jgi:nanoRNase/pAp phosphatase (c-di-AMP/oligoRNAs hydrolase)
LNKAYNKLLDKAKEFVNPKSNLIYFSYSGNFSISSEIANELYFNYPDKTIVVVYRNNEKVNVSIRGKKAKQITEKAIKDIENATGGGHQEATGAQIPGVSYENFKENIFELVK